VHIPKFRLSQAIKLILGYALVSLGWRLLLKQSPAWAMQMQPKRERVALPFWLPGLGFWIHGKKQKTFCLKRPVAVHFVKAGML
jgi:hypothetical protein